MENMPAEELAAMRSRLEHQGIPTGAISDEQLKGFIRQRMDDFQDKAPVTPAQAATMILDGVRSEQWRILVGEDAHALDRLVREQPEMAYELSFLGQLQAAGHFNELIPPVPSAEPASDTADLS
jgi:hypothetical protein